jgi:hypothetical protein
MRDSLPLRIQRIACRQLERFQARGADRIGAALPLWQSHSDQDERVFVQVIEAHRIPLQHALELAACRGQIGVEV